MAVRIISSVVAIPLLLIFITAGGLPLRIAVLLLSLIGMYELYKAVSGKIKAVHIVGFLLEIIYAYFAVDHSVDISYVKALFCSVTMIILFILVVCHRTNNINDAAVTVFGFFYVGLLLSLICYVREVSIFFAWLPFLFAFGSDTGAYFVGSKFGKHKLTPELSPKKTVEGAAGGIIFAALFTAIYSFVLYKFYDFSPEYIIIFSIGAALGSVAAQFGDLAASSIKRYVKIKDFGKLMPGHGGVLDRFDSVLFTLPLVYIIMLIYA